tara:strand:+ start:401 stop:1396 length:996 start_codon:yes stop_codon:yes gene_type:complete
MKFFFKILIIIIISELLILSTSFSAKQPKNFNEWLISFEALALQKGISANTIKIVFKDVKFLDQVIKYDRKQPEFFEDTITYVSKRASIPRAYKAKKLLEDNKKLFAQVEDEFNVEKEILLSLWGIETNFGKHVGKMDIISSLATLSYDQRRSKFFTSQLLILLKLVDKKLIDPSTLYGSWAGAYGNFQFMPSSIERYALDYDKNNKIELKDSLDDALASAANYINKIGWKINEPCFYKVKLTKNINKKYINLSARKIKNKLNIKSWKKKGIVIADDFNPSANLKAALIMPDGKPNSPTYIVFSNYEKILQWNRSLRFGITVCTLADMIKS